MPADFDGMVAFCTRWRIPQDHPKWERFRDWALSSPKAIKLDWYRTWSNALRTWLADNDSAIRLRAAGEKEYRPPSTMSQEMKDLWAAQDKLRKEARK